MYYNKPLNYEETNIPLFQFKLKKNFDNTAPYFYELSSHRRAKIALQFGLEMRAPQFHLFVMGDNGTNRLDATVAYVKNYTKHLPPPQDWLFLNDFHEENGAVCITLPAGQGVLFQKKLMCFVDQIQKELKDFLKNDESGKTFRKEKEKLEESVYKDLSALKKKIEKAGFVLIKEEEGQLIVSTDSATKQQTPQQIKTALALQNEIDALFDKAQEKNEHFHQVFETEQEKRLVRCLKGSFKEMIKGISVSVALKKWLEELRQDIIAQRSKFITQDIADKALFLKRYAVNIFVGHDQNAPAPVVIEPNPTKENVFGAIKYHTVAGGLQTDYSLIRAGSLHKANGGFLILRAESLAKHPETWEALKIVLRDQKICLKDVYEAQQHSAIETPVPGPIPLNVQIILVGAPDWYYTFFFGDIAFKNFFKVKADIEPHFRKSSKDLELYGNALFWTCLEKTGMKCHKDAIGYLMGYSCRYANHREKISTKFDLLLDILIESAFIAKKDKKKGIHLKHVNQAIQSANFRNDSLKDLSHADVMEGITKIRTTGQAVGEVNGLTVQSIGAISFGLPTRITARTYMGRKGLINIEHIVNMSGPIQHKGVLEVEGYIRGVFSQAFPITFSGSVTFEQTYVTVEGDSASLAETCVVLSSLGRFPLRQDLAITGSMNQLGEVQAVGGVNEKIEGFYYACEQQGLSGTQGVIIPEANRTSIALSPEVSDAILKKKFFIWCVERIEQAMEILSGLTTGVERFEQDNKDKTAYGKVYKTLQKYETILKSHHYYTSGRHGSL